MANSQVKNYISLAVNKQLSENPTKDMARIRFNPH